MTRRPCRLCGHPILVVKSTIDNVMMALDAVAIVYEVRTDLAFDPTAAVAPGFYVSHFVTCPKREQLEASIKEGS